MKRGGINGMLLEGLSLWILVIMTKATNFEDSVPVFLEEPESAVISHHASVTLPCKVLPSSAVVRWKFNGDFVKEGGSRGFSFKGTDLHIASFKHKRKQESNVGIYQCIAKTSVGAVASRPARLSKTVLKRFQSREDLHLNGTFGHSIVLPCQPPVSSPEANILFELNGTILSTSSDHYRLLSSGYLLIQNLTLNDQGQYQCIAVNPVSNQNRTSSHKIYLSVRNHTAGYKSGIVNVYRPTVVEAHEGENVTIECVAIGLPPPNISWEKYGGKLQSNHVVTVQGNLLLINVTQEDAGTYLCKVDSGNGEHTVKDVYLKLIEPPLVTAENTSIKLNRGESVKLRCQIKGSPKPEVIWYRNAVPVTNILNVDENQGTTYNLNHVIVDDAGLYQCMSSNDIGMDYAVIKVEVKGADGVYPTNSIKKDKKKNPKIRRKNGKKRRKNRRNRKNNQKLKSRQPVNDGPDTKVKMVPPSAPDVSQLSDTSVKLNWTVEPNDGLKIVFFRVQYRVIKPKRSPWQTDETEIPGDRRQYEVKNLVPEGTFKFRIAAVYENNDNKMGPNSDKFTLHLPTYQEPKAPEKAPVIVEVKPVEYRKNYALNIRWSYHPVKSSPIEGFFLYYKPFSSDDEYKKEMLMEPALRVFLLTDLEPGTEYSIQMKCFNSAGMSDFSNSVVMKTQGVGKKPDFPFIPTTSKPPSERSDEGSPTKSDTQANSEMLYMILGIVLGVMMLLLIVFMFMCWWKQRQQRRMMDAMNDAVLRNKFQDPSQRIYADSLRKKYVNGGYTAVPTAPVQNGQVQNTYTKMNVSVNPLSDVDMHSISNGHTGQQYHQQSTQSFVPNGTLPSQFTTSDNNFNNKRSMDHSLDGSQCLNTPDSMGSGEAPAIPPSPNSYSVPIGYDQFTTSDSQEQNSNKSCDQLAESHDQNSIDVVKQCDSSLASENSVHSGKHKRRRKRQAASRENSTRDQATNTDLSSNEGTIEFSHVNRDSPESNTRTSSSEECDQVV